MRRDVILREEQAPQGLGLAGDRGGDRLDRGPARRRPVEWIPNAQQTGLTPLNVHVAVSPDGRTIASAGGWYTDSGGENYTSEKKPMIRLWQMSNSDQAEVSASETGLPISTTPDW